MYQVPAFKYNVSILSGYRFFKKIQRDFVLPVFCSLKVARVQTLSKDLGFEERIFEKQKISHPAKS